uniref:RabBD domain-containing protein n=2 Tax=Mesocestoides corti TaxID=53468 RepID=A0A5K3FJ64_MESCO
MNSKTTTSRPFYSMGRSISSQRSGRTAVQDTVSRRSRRASEPPPFEVNLSPFSEEERRLILSVVKRDLELRCMEKQRLKKIRRGLLLEDSKAPLSLPGAARNCTICSSQFLMLINPRVTCDLCKRDVCKRCSKVYSEDLLCSICSRDVFYKAMVCQWFYSNTSKQSSGCASDAIVKSLFRDNLPGLNDLTDEQMYDTITRYLGPNRRTYVNGEFITPEVMQKIQNEQIRLFHKKYKGIKSSALADLLKVRANAQVGDSKINEVEIEATTARFLQQTREALTQLLKMLCITEEKYNVTLDLPRKQPTGSQVLAIVQRQVEHIVGHTIEVRRHHSLPFK